MPSNSGANNRTTIGIVPEVGLNAGVCITPHMALTFGYSFDTTGNHTTNWSATAPTTQVGLTGYFTTATNTFLAPGDESWWASYRDRLERAAMEAGRA